MWRRAPILISWILLCGGAVQGWAQPLSFDATVDHARYGQADPIRLKLTITANESLSHLPAPEIDLKDFYVEGPGVSTQMNIVNFNTSFTRELTYTLYARRTGKITIGPARLKFGNKTYETRPITVEIAAGSTRQLPRSIKQNSSDQGVSLDEYLFVAARPDREKAYIGQQVTVDYDLFYRYQLHNVGFKEIPSFTGFWVKELFVAQQLQGRREVVEGVAFNAAPLRRVALFPTHAGRHRVDPLVVSCDVPQRSGRRGSLFDDLLLGRGSRTVLLSSDSLEVEVLPLPEAGQPEGFTGAVGRFALDVQSQPSTLAVGDPVTVRVTIGGVGNLDAIEVPEFDVPPGIKAYDPKIEEEESTRNGLYGGRRSYEYILIPEVGGILEVPPIRFVYFDPEQEMYRVLESEPIFINSQGAAATQEPESYGLSRRDIQAVGQDIRYIKPNAEGLGRGMDLYRSAGFWSLQGMLPLAFLGLLFHQRHRQRLEGDVAYARRRRARGEAGRRLKRAGELLEAEDGVEFYAEIQRALLAFLADRLNLAAAGLTQESSGLALEEKGVEAALVKRMRDLLAQCDYARFASAASKREEMEQVRARAGKLINRLDKVI
jgi:hypothetical protein